ncbi:uncharacterized protein [Amphiura filiformis]|uniref:uncharacterized protein n=1 Tax=Amphiura filiformis TaxID=82378 RepID=UPI003B21F6F4
MLTLPPGIVGVNDINRDIARMSEEGVQETVSEEVFSSYKASISIPGAQVHPGDIVVAASLSDVPLPKATYELAESIPSDMITSGKLSSLQLEGVLYACQRHQRTLPDGNRAGFFLGDAAGVGKGRQIAAIILDNYVRGRTKHIWFSISADLKVDAQRDVKDLGCHIKVIEGCQHLDKETRVFGLPSDFTHGVIFSTYATLVSSVSKGGGWSNKRRSRLDQLIKWCGGDKFDGCLIFDECHKAKHFVPGKESSSTKVAVAVTSIQRMLPNARVLYCSATGVTDVKNMAFMERLGLWGTGAPFKSFDHFLEAINRRGLGVAEMLAMEMKASGMYVSRGLSFRAAEFDTIETPLTPKQNKMYDVAAHVWNELRKALESAIERTNTSSSRVWSSFWGCHQRFFKQLCLGVKVPAVVKEAKAALESGHSVVIGLQTTGEASLESEMLKSDSKLTEFISIAREILIRFINQHFPTQVIVSPNEPRKDDEWSVQAKNLLMGFATKIELPNSPLDEIIDQLGGTSAVAEMTGRRGRLVRTGGPNSEVQYELRAAENNDVGIESLNVKERNSFMEGRKLIAIISDAASTGISLHADTRVANQRRRVHLTMELPWSADKAVQQLGRSHRSNQSSGPLYKLLTTNLGGERRFAAAVARRLQSLGALTQGDRRAASGADLTQFNFDTNYGRSALRSMYSSICNRQVVGGVEFSKLSQGKMDFADFNTSMQQCLSLMGVLETGLTHLKVSDKEDRNVSKFLNRILGVAVKKQNLIFNYFFESLQATIATAKKEGKYSEGLVDIKASSVEMLGARKQVFLDAKTSTPTYHMSISVDRGMTWEQVVDRASVHTGTRDGFYKSKKEQFGKYLYLLATQKPNSTHLFRIARPNTGISAFDEEIGELLTRYNPVSKEKAESGWKEQYEACKSKCIHGKHCKHPTTCHIGSRCYRMDLLCGGIVTLMATLENTSARFADKMQLSKASYSMKVVRVELSDGERMIGIRYPSDLLDKAEQVFKENKAMEALQTRLNLGPNGLPVLTKPNPEPASKANIDPASPVNPKLLNKAMTEPRTIRSFFKPVSATSTNVPKDKPSQGKGQKSKGQVSKVIDDDDEPMIISDSSNSESSSPSSKSPSLISSSAAASSKPSKSPSQSPTNTDEASTDGESSISDSSFSTPTTSRRSLRSQPKRNYVLNDDSDDDGDDGDTSKKDATDQEWKESESDDPPDQSKLTRKCKTCKKSKALCACKANTRKKTVSKTNISKKSSEKEASQLSKTLDPKESEVSTGKTSKGATSNTGSETATGSSETSVTPNGISAKSPAQTKDSDSSDNEVVGKKRPLKDNNCKIVGWFSQPSKRTKQSSLASSFARITEAKQKKVLCPICDEELPSGTSNEQLNSHVDKCLQGQ